MNLYERFNKKFAHPSDEAGLINPANLFTMARVPLGMYGIWLFTQGQTVLGAWIVAIAMLSDLLDGIIARVFRCKTRFGRLMDPIADKLLTIMVMIFLFSETGNQGDLRVLLVLILGYDLLVATWTLYLKRTQRYDIVTTYIGKKAGFARMVASAGVFLYIAGVWDGLRPLAIAFGLLGLSLGLLALYQYAVQGARKTPAEANAKFELWPYGYDTRASRFLADPFGLKKRLGIFRE